MNVLSLAGIAIFLGTISGKIFQRFKIPQVVGYIILGLIIGKSFFHIFEGEVVTSLIPIVNFTLGIIGCIIGAELKGSVFKKYGTSIYTMLFTEGILAFLAVTIAVTLITKKLYLGLILGAIASATDPASTISVLWEYKAKGPLTRTLTSIIALDDGLALILYGLVSVFSKSMMMGEHFSLLEGLGRPLLEIGECLLIGGVSAFIVANVIKHIKEESLIVAFILGVIASIVGVSMYFNLDLILTSMMFGATLANLLPRISEKIFGEIKEMTTSLYILFFVAIGAQLDIHTFLNVTLLGIIGAYLVARSFGKIFGAMFGGFITKAPKTVTKYTGLCLFTQGGVAMGLALSISHNLSQLGGEGAQVGILIINVVAATTFVVQLIGPPLVKYGITKAEERGRNITKDDIIESLLIEDVMDKKVQAVSEGTTLSRLIDLIRTTGSFNYVVVDKLNQFCGVITIKELKDAMFESDLKDIVLAKDILIQTNLVVLPNEPLVKAFELFNNRDLNFLPVIKDKNYKEVVGMIEEKEILEEIERRLFEVQHKILDD